MVKAFPLNAKGEQEGEIRNFPDTQWFNMVRTNGKKLRWKLVTDEEVSKPTELIKLIDYNSMSYIELKELAKQKGIKKYSSMKKENLIELLKQ